MDDTAVEWLAFHMIFHGRSPAARRVLGRFGSPREAFRAGPGGFEGLRLDSGLARAMAGRGALDRAAGELEIVREKGYTLLTFEDPGYPGSLREIFDPPFVLYCRGRAETLRNPAVAVVGSRRPTPYGRAMAEKLAGDLAMRGCVVVSGLALGIDACAHWGALRHGRTVAVLGSGLDVMYPAENGGLADKIAERGAVVSEFPLGTAPLPMNFPVRNRIISGLSLALVVVEAAERSGSLISARLALSQDREVLAVPGKATSPLSRGSNALIREGAKLVETWEDVAGELAPPWREKFLAQKEEKMDNRPALSREEQALLDALPVDETRAIDDLAENMPFSVSELLALLLGLELKGAVIQHPGKHFQRRM